MPKEEQGVTSDRYMVIPRVLIFVTQPGRILLIKGSPNKRLWANKYNGIGGHVEAGEDVLAAAQRELAEETGLQGVDLRLCGNIMVNASDRIGISIFLFKGAYTGGKITPSEEGRCEWVPIDEVDKLPLVEDLYTVIPKILAFRIGDVPMIGRTWYDEKDQMVIQFQ